MTLQSDLVPLLVVRDAARAIDFYVTALGATVLTRFQHGPQRRISHADLALGDAVSFSVTEEARAWNSDAPPSLGGSPVVLQLRVEDAEGALGSLCGAGAAVVFPLQEILGERMARVRDPFGHLWILRQRLEELSLDEIQRRREARFARLATEGVPQTTAAGLKDKVSLSETAARRQAPSGVALSPPEGSAHRARVHLLLGPVGAGKSTWAMRLAHEHAAVWLGLDQWMTTLFRPDRPETGLWEWYAERSARCIDQIWTLSQALLQAGSGAVLEIGLLRRGERARFFQRLESAGCPWTAYVLDAERDVRRQRVEARNQTRGATFSMPVPPDVFELASDLWEPLDPAECAGRDIYFIRTDD